MDSALLFKASLESQTETETTGGDLRGREAHRTNKDDQDQEGRRVEMGSDSHYVSVVSRENAHVIECYQRPSTKETSQLTIALVHKSSILPNTRLGIFRGTIGQVLQLCKENRSKLQD